MSRSQLDKLIASATEIHEKKSLSASERIKALDIARHALKMKPRRKPRVNPTIKKLLQGVPKTPASPKS
jgi:hypothetical protein